MIDILNKFKDRRPEETIQIVTNFFNNIGYEVVVVDLYKTIISTWWCTLRLKDQKTNEYILGSNGKGEDENFAQASGLAELYERFCAGQFLYSNPFTYQQLVQFNNDIKTISLEQFMEDINVQFLYKQFFNNLDDFQLYLQTITNCQEITGYKYINLLDNNDIKYFNIPLIYRFQGSTGLAAGNSLNEALVQGISEWFERYVFHYLFLDSSNKIKRQFYYVDIKNLSTNIQEKCAIIKNMNNNIKIIDLSYTFNIPVCMILVINLETSHIHYSFGAAPNFDIAVERAFTELYQGIRDEEWLDYTYLQIPFKSAMRKEEPLIVQNMTGVPLRKSCPLDFLSLEEKEYISDVYLNTKEIEDNNTFINYYLSLLKQHNILLYYKDFSLCQDIVTIQLYSPNINIYNNNLYLAHTNYQNRKKYLDFLIILNNIIYKILNNNLSFDELSYYINILKQYNYKKDFINLRSLICNDWFNPLFNSILYNNNFQIFNMLNYIENTDIIPQNETLDNDNNFYLMIYNYFKEDYTLDEIYQIAKHFKQNITLSEIEQCSQINYIIYKVFLQKILLLYNSETYKNLLNTIIVKEDTYV